MIQKPVKIQYLKPFLSVTEQLNRLKSRGLIIKDLSKVKNLLSHVNYYRLEAYWYTFYIPQKDEHQFMPGTTFDIIWKHYCFDCSLRAVFSRTLEIIEVSFKTQFAYYLSEAYGAFPFELKNFNFSSQEWTEEFYKLKESCQKSNEQFPKHFYSKYLNDILPIWALVEVQSFGNIVRYYKKMKPIKTKNQIGNVYGLQPRELSSWMEHLTYIRNICAHHGRLWNRRLVKLPKPPQFITHNLISQLWISTTNDKQKNNYYNERRIYNTILIIDFFLSKISPDNKLKKEVVSLIKNYSIDSKRMGFPKNWESSTFWKN